MAATDQELISGIKSGNQSALAALIELYYESLSIFVIRYVDSADAADDVLQELFLRIWERRNDWEVRSSLRVYMYTAARNAALHAVARRDARMRAEGKAVQLIDNKSPDASSGVENSDLAAAARAAVASLPERCREVYLLSAEHGLSYSEIAELLGISVSTVKTQMGRAFSVLDARLAPFLVLTLMLAS